MYLIIVFLFFQFSYLYANTDSVAVVNNLSVENNIETAITTTTLSLTLSANADNVLPLSVSEKVEINYAVEKIDFDTNTINTIIIKWFGKENMEFFYNVYKKKEGDPDFYKINENPLSVTFYVDADVNTGTIYYYKVETIDSLGNTFLSKEYSVRSTDLYLPSPPFGFKVYQDVECSVLKWNSSSKGTFEITGYIIYRGEDAESMTKIAEVKPTELKFNDEEVIPAKKYYYKVTAVDERRNESNPTEILSCVPFPMQRTCLILMPTAYRNDIFNNWGLNIDLSYTYYIGGIFGEHNLFPYGNDSDSFLKVGASILSGDVKLSGFNDENQIPSIAFGYVYTILMQDKFGSSQTTGVQASFTGKEKESMKMMGGFYSVISKKVFFDMNLHTGYILGEQINFIPYLSKYLTLEDNIVAHGYFIGFSRKIFSRMGLRTEIIVPAENKINQSLLMPVQYLINTYIDRFINFNISYFHFNGGYVWLGYINFKFTIFPNPYK